MDDPLDFIDLFELIGSTLEVGNLDSGSIDALGTLLDKLDYSSFNGEMAHAVADIDPANSSFWVDAEAGLFPQAELMDWGHLAAGDEVLLSEAAPATSDQFIDLGGDLDDFGDWAGEFDPVAIQESLEAAFHSYPPAFTEGLTVEDIFYDPAEHPKDPRTLGAYNTYLNPDGSTSRAIILFDHADTAGETFHHEMGHHIARINPEFFNDAIESLECDSKFLKDQQEFLANYPSSKHKDELFAQGIEAYRTQPEILEEDDPRLFQVIDRHWAANSVA